MYVCVREGEREREIDGEREREIEGERSIQEKGSKVYVGLIQKSRAC